MAHSHMAVLVPISVVPVPRVYCRVWLGWYGTNKTGTGTTWLLPLFLCWYRYHFFFFFLASVPIYRTFQNALHLGFNWMLTSFPASYPFQPDLCSWNCVLHSLDTFTLTLESAVLLVITIPRVRTYLKFKAQDGCKGLTQYDLEV